MADIIDYSKRLSISRHFWYGILAIVLFWTLAELLPFTSVYATVSVVQLSFALWLVVSFLPGFLQALVSDQLRDGEMLVMGIWIAFAGDALLRLWAMTQRALDYPDWMVSSDIVSFFIYIKLMGAGLHLSSPDVHDGKLPRGSWIKFGVAFALGAGAAVGLLATSIGSKIFEAL